MLSGSVEFHWSTAALERTLCRVENAYDTEPVASVGARLRVVFNALYEVGALDLERLGVLEGWYGHLSEAQRKRLGVPYELPVLP